MAKDFKDATVVPLFKIKSSKAYYENNWSIFLLSIVRRFSCFIPNHLITSISEEKLPEALCGSILATAPSTWFFQFNSSEKCIKQNVDLYVAFTDLTKAFHVVHREAFWVILSKLRCPRFVHHICLFHDDMTGVVLSGGEFQILLSFPMV